MFCFHKWKIIGTKLYVDVSFGVRQPMTAYHLQCEKCGNIKEKYVYNHVEQKQ